MFQIPQDPTTPHRILFERAFRREDLGLPVGKREGHYHGGLVPALSRRVLKHLWTSISPFDKEKSGGVTEELAFLYIPSCGDHKQTSPTPFGHLAIWRPTANASGRDRKAAILREVRSVIG